MLKRVEPHTAQGSGTAYRSPVVRVLCYPALSLYEYAIAHEVFGQKKPEQSGCWYDYAAVNVSSEVGFMGPDSAAPLSDLSEADLIIIPGWQDRSGIVPEPLNEVLSNAHNRGARIATFCTGIFALARTGLLEGTRITTHWRYIDELAALVPRAEIAGNVLYVDSGGVLTSAGSSAALDLSLHIVRQDFGTEAANIVARSLVVPAHREGGQSQFVPRPVAKNERGSLAPVLDELRARPEENWDTSAIASLAAMSPRSLHRRFREATGTSPMDWLIRERITLACDLLENTNLTVDAIATRVGFGSAVTFRQHFLRLMTVSPSQHRSSFATPRGR